MAERYGVGSRLCPLEASHHPDSLYIMMYIFTTFVNLYNNIMAMLCRFYPKHTIYTLSCKIKMNLTCSYPVPDSICIAPVIVLVSVASGHVTCSALLIHIVHYDLEWHLVYIHKGHMHDILLQMKETLHD